MKITFKARIAILVVLSIVLFQATLTLSFAQNMPAAAVREESTSLENLYQEKVRNILDNLIAPEDYTLVISATIKNDDRKLKEYSDTIERKFMPGLPINDPASFADANNLLLELKQKVDIQIILTENVPADRDGIVKDVIKNKLHLSEETGDSIAVVRAARIVPYPKPTEQRWFPELSAKMIAFWVLVSMMVLTGILLWAQRRKEKAKQQERAEQAFLIEQKRAHEEAKAEEQKKEEAESPVAQSEGLTEEEKNELEVKMAFEKSEIHKLCTDYGPIVAKAVEEFMIQGHVRESVMVMEALGWHESKRLFRDLDTRSWAKIGSTLRTRQGEPSIVEIFEAAHYFHRFALSYVLERTAKDDGNPFSFVFKLNDNQRIDLLNREAPDKIALIGVYCTGPQMTDFLRGLESSKQNEILFHLTRIKQLPETEVKSGVLSYLASLERIKKDPSIFADGPMLAADFLRSLPAGREEELIQYLFDQHPSEAEKLRRVRVMFQDIPYYPAELTRKVIENLESDLIQRALTGYDRAFTDEFLQLLPSKKGLMIQNDLLHGDGNLPQSQCAESRREICGLIERHFEAQKFRVFDYWKDQDQVSGISREITREYGSQTQAGSGDEDFKKAA
jgi:flagellar motor switch protein FliG